MDGGLVVVGASAGGVTALKRLAAGLPGSFPLPVLVVLHLSPELPSLLPELLSTSGPLPAAAPRDGEALRPAHIYVAPPDRHLVVNDGRVSVTRGPTENRHRPAVDVLFRSAALARGPNAIGVVLTGTMDDGTAGLAAIKERGGIAVVQDPEDAEFPQMPQNALRRVSADYTVPLATMPELLVRLAHGEPRPAPPTPPDDDLVREVKGASLDLATLHDPIRPGTPSTLTCPDCGGVLREIREGKNWRTRCLVGHAYGLESLEQAQKQSVEAGLFAALRSLEERIALRQRMADDARERARESYAKELEKAIPELRKHVASLRTALAALGDD